MNNGAETHAGVHFVFDAGVKKIDEQLRSVESLDVKMGVLIGFLGALIAGFFAAILASDADKLARLLATRAVEAGLVLTAILLASDLYFAFQSFRLRKLYSGAPFERLVEWTNEEVTETKRAFLPTLIKATDLNGRQIDVKQQNAVRAVWAVFVTLLALLVTLAMIAIRILSV